MTKNSALVLVAAGSVVLCGCSGGGETEATFAEMMARGEALEAEIAGLDYADPARLPDVGALTYTGVAGAFVPGDYIIGEIELTAAFSSNTISGQIDNLTSEELGQYAGAIEIGNGVIDRTVDPEVDYTFAADLTGEIQSPVGDEMVIDGALQGDFFGDDILIVEGTIDGNIIGPDGIDFFEGGFIADR